MGTRSPHHLWSSVPFRTSLLQLAAKARFSLIGRREVPAVGGPTQMLTHTERCGVQTRYFAPLDGNRNTALGVDACCQPVFACCIVRESLNCGGIGCTTLPKKWVASGGCAMPRS